MNNLKYDYALNQNEEYNLSQLDSDEIQETSI